MWTKKETQQGRMKGRKRVQFLLFAVTYMWLWISHVETVIIRGKLKVFYTCSRYAILEPSPTFSSERLRSFSMIRYCDNSCLSLASLSSFVHFLHLPTTLCTEKRWIYRLVHIIVTWWYNICKPRLHQEFKPQTGPTLSVLKYLRIMSFFCNDICKL